MLTTAPGTRVRLAPHRLHLRWAPPVGTVLAPAADDLFAADAFTGTVPAADPALWAGAGERVAVRWDGHRHPDWVDAVDLVPAGALVAVA